MRLILLPLGRAPGQAPAPTPGIARVVLHVSDPGYSKRGEFHSAWCWFTPQFRRPDIESVNLLRKLCELTLSRCMLSLQRALLLSRGGASPQQPARHCAL